MRYLHWSGDEGIFCGGFTLGLFPPTTMTRGGARPHHVEPGADDDEDAGDHPPVLPARRTTSAHRGLRREARRHRRALPRPRRPGRRRGRPAGSPSSSRRCSPRREKRGRRARRSRRSGRTCASSSAAASRRRRTSRSSATSSGGTTSRWSTRTTRPRAACTRASDFSGARGMLMLPHRGHVLRVRPPRGARDARIADARAALGGRARPAVRRSSSTTVVGPLRVQLGDIVRFPQTCARCASSSWGASRAASRSRRS